MRQTTQIFFVCLSSLVGLCAGDWLVAADVEVRLSQREAFVGSTLKLEIEIINAEDYALPELPQVDGLEIRELGAPMRSSQTTIINGRRSSKQSVLISYSIKILRAGSFEIPPLKFSVDGQNLERQVPSFIASNSETGDLLFAELEGQKDRVYVGQPLDMTLKIYIKPYRDREYNVTLSEGNMWQLLSDDTEWGSFSERMRELNENNQRPGGREVLRNDLQGHRGAYYMYEVDAKIYPKRAGKIDADDVKIVVNYPTALGKPRDPIQSLFGDRAFGGSLFSPMMRDEFFESAFGPQLVVSSVRPVVTEVSVDNTQVLPVPSAGRPADYRGAVGQYKIVVDASPTDVRVGDSINLNLGIVGTGPMELVQAPPLSELPSLADFKISNDPLAGFVQDDAKVFSVKLRPKHANIREIPPVAFSFFNPETEKFETVYSQSIPIQVQQADTLALDSIVAAQTQRNSDQQPATSMTTPLTTNFINDSSPAVLVSQPTSARPWWLVWVIAPPLVWLVTLIGRHWGWLRSRLPSFRSPRQIFLRELDQAQSPEDIRLALQKFIHRNLTGGNRLHDEWTTTLGSLRTLGHYPLAADLEAFAARLERTPFVDSNDAAVVEVRQAARSLIDGLESQLRDTRRPAGSRSSQRTSLGARNSFSKFGGRVSMLLFGCLSVSTVHAADASLSQHQRESLLSEAHAVYEQACKLVDSDSLQSKEDFQAAAAKYQLLVDAGIQNAGLYVNLGNANLRSGQVGRAIVAYRRALKIDPLNQQAGLNLSFAESLLEQSSSTTPGNEAGFLAYWVKQALEINSLLVRRVGLANLRAIIIASSIAFWGLLIARPILRGWRVGGLALLPMLILIAAGVAYALPQFAAPAPQAVMVADQVSLRTGDGEQFDKVLDIPTADGQPAEILAERSGWVKVRTATGQEGWLPADQVLRI